MLRALLGPICLELVAPDIDRPFYRAVTTLDALALMLDRRRPGYEAGGARGPEGGRHEFAAP